MTSSLLQLDRVSLAASIGVDYILQNISFTINEEEKVAIIGASGSGKTSLLRLLNRLNSPLEGNIFFTGIPYQQHPVLDLRRQIMLVPQEPKLLGMTGKEALIYPLKLQQFSDKIISDRLYKYTNSLQIPPEWLEKNELQLSLGQRQLITIVRALMLEPKILLLDEPTSALDTGLSDRLLTVLNQVNQEQKTTILMVNHQLELSEKFAERILYLNSGQLFLDIPATPENWQLIKQQLLQEAQTQAQEWNDY